MGQTGDITTTGKASLFPMSPRKKRRHNDLHAKQLHRLHGVMGSKR